MKLLRDDHGDCVTKPKEKSLPIIEIILARMMSDSTFAETVFVDPEKALAEYHLSVDEMAKFKGLTRKQFEAMSPENRTSMISFVEGPSIYHYGYD